MTPSKALIAQRLTEVARELNSIAELTDDFNHLHHYAGRIAELRRTAELAQFWATEIRSEP